MAAILDMNMVENRSLSQSKARWVGGLIALAIVVASLPHISRGAWPVGLFALLYAALLGVFWRRFIQGAPPKEHLVVTRDVLSFDRADSRGRTHAEFEPAWTRVELEEPSDLEARVWLIQRRRRCEIGRCLPYPERRQLAATVENALQVAKRGGYVVASGGPSRPPPAGASFWGTRNPDVERGPEPL